MTGYIRHPRAKIVTDAGEFSPIECHVHVSKHQSADTFEAVLSLDIPSASYWCDTAPISVTVLGTNDIATGGWKSMITGKVDEIEADFHKRTVWIKGRDATAEMTDRKTTEKWQNKKPEEIIQDLAGRAGLTAQIQGQSTDKAGLKYKDDYNKISEYDNFWNVVTRLAKHMGCVAFVKDQQLLIQPYDFSGGGVYAVTYVPPTAGNPAEANVIDLKCSRNVNLSKNVKVNHKSWRHKEGEAIESEYQSTGTGGGDLEYSFKGANLTKQQQDQLSQTKLDEILSHERTPRIHTYGDVNIDPQMMLSLSGTGTGFDQSYIISSISHHWEEDDGYKMDVEVRNKDSKRGGASQSK